jgi:FlgD Ig-like domain
VKRLPLVAFGALVVATVGAFFVTQHLKVSTPLINGGIGLPHPNPHVISPRETGCGGAFRVANFSFYLQHRADDVAVYIVDQNGSIVRTLASGRHMPTKVRVNFPWNGREDNRRIAPDGTYYYRVALLQQGRTVEYTKTPVTVKTMPPKPIVTAVSPLLIPRAGRLNATISFRGNEGNPPYVQIYRTDLPGPPRLLKSFRTSWKTNTATWDGTIHGRAAPAGTYLVGMRVQDKACNVGTFPVTIPPPRGLTPHAGVTVRYLAAQPPLTPVRAGATAIVYVDSRQRPYRWALRRIGSKKVLRHGSGRTIALHVRVPNAGAGLYELAIRSGGDRTLVPLVTSRSHSPAKLLVVLPALTWQGLNPVDDDGDGLPNTLSGGGPVALSRPLVGGLSEVFGDEAGFMSYLDRQRLPYDLTTDIGLIEGVGPKLSGHRGVVFAGDERWLPPLSAAALRDYVRRGGRVLNLGIDSLRRSVTVRGGIALSPSPPAATDIFGARIGRLVTNNHDFILVGPDRLGIFSTGSTVFSGFRSFQTFSAVAPPAGPIASSAGTSTSTQSIIGFPLARGTVVEIGLVGFGSSLAHNIGAQELVSRLWTVLSG